MLLCQWSGFRQLQAVWDVAGDSGCSRGVRLSIFFGAFGLGFGGVSFLLWLYRAALIAALDSQALLVFGLALEA